MDSKVTRERTRSASMRKLFGFLSLMFVACSLSGVLPSAKAQPSKGTVSGIAKDSGGSPLQGARVQLDPTGKQVVTEDDGQFRITDVAPGDYTLTVSYVGLAPFSKAIKVEGDTKVDAQLEVASRVDSVVVTAGRVQGEAEAINIERTAQISSKCCPPK